MHFIFAGATPLVEYDFYREGYAREADVLTPYDVDSDNDDSEGSGFDQPIVYVSKREVSLNYDKTVIPIVRSGNNNTKNGTESHSKLSDVECGNTTVTSNNCTLRKRPTTTVLAEVNEKHEQTISEETRRKIAEVQAEPVILTQGV